MTMRRRRRREEEEEEGSNLSFVLNFIFYIYLSVGLTQVEGSWHIIMIPYPIYLPYLLYDTLPEQCMLTSLLEVLVFFFFLVLTFVNRTGYRIA
ncbi:hypothetical protein HOY80DRAFT_948698 [Tuber brumale]|nr:hypothetical protein HOY80DRAFT_948698 [Tuber brumale]